MLQFPKEQPRVRLELFSDEAERDLKGGSRLCAFSFIGVGSDHLQPIQDGLRTLKTELAPDLDPDSWVSHATDLVSGDRRQKLLGGRAVSRKAAFDFLGGLASLIKGLGHPDFTHVAGGIARRPSAVPHASFVRQHREMVLSGAYISLVDLFMANGYRPEFCFESVRPQTADVVEEWIERVIRRLGKSVAMLHVYRSSAINLPRMAPKGSDIRLELADLIAFVVARYVHCRSINRDPELDPALLGSLHYHFWIGNEFHSHRSEGFPWNHFFANLSF